MSRVWLLAAVALALAACGGGGGGSTAEAPGAPAWRGQLLESPAPVGTFTVAELDAGTTARALRAATGPARCAVQVQALHYRTPGVDGSPSDASAALLLPAAGCVAGPLPLLSYTRSTEVHRPRTLASTGDWDTFLLAAMYATQGHAVVATDYLGFARSTHATHPYLHAATEATTVIDAVRAARHAAAAQGVALSGDVRLAGYSQGAHASMAAQRAIEAQHASEIRLAGSAHLAGPYNVSGLLQGDLAIVGVQYFMTFLVTSWQQVEGGIYRDPREAFREPYAATVEGLLPSRTHTFDSLRSTGALPGNDVSPAQARDLLFVPAFLAQVRQDAGHPLRAAARRNDLMDWAPATPTLLCGGRGDPTVSPALHQDPLKASFDRRGLTGVRSVDVDAAIQAAHGVQGRAPDDPASEAYQTYYANYHTFFEPPLCHAVARRFFDGTAR